MTLIKFSLFCSIAVAIVSINFQECFAKPANKIVGGRTAAIEEIPAIVSVRYGDQHLCGGTLISKKHVLTAAHCVLDKNETTGQLEFMNVRYFTIGTGSNYRLNMKNVYSVAKVFAHPRYTGDLSNNPNDIAIIKLNEEIREDSRQQIMNLPTSNIEPGMKGFVAGWGASDEKEEKSNPFLQIARMEVVSNDVCQKYLASVISPEHVCASLRKGVGFCSGDSGGPLIINEAVVGIVSMSGVCGNGSPDVYTRVIKFIPWIKYVMLL